MKTAVLILALLVCGCLAVPLRAQNDDNGGVLPPRFFTPPPAVAPTARANDPAAVHRLRPANGDDGKRGPRGPEDWLAVTALSPDGRFFVTRNLDNRLRLWALAGGTSTELPAGAIDAVFSPDGRVLACLFEKTADGKAGRRWQVFATADFKPAGESLVLPEGEKDASAGVFFSADSKWLAGFVGAGNAVRVALWDAGGKLLATQPAGEIYGGGVMAFSPDGKTLATGGSGSAVLLWSVPDLKRLQTFAFDNKSVVAVAFSPDGKELAVGGDEQRTVRGQRDGYPFARLYEAATGKLAAELKISPARGERVRQVVFADGGRALATASDKDAQVWSARDGRLIANLPDAGYPLAVSPDGKIMAGAAFPDLYCWDTSAWRLGLKIADARPGYGTGTGPMGYVPLAFTPDGATIVGVTGNSVEAWELPGGQLKTEHRATQSQVAY